MKNAKQALVTVGTLLVALWLYDEVVQPMLSKEDSDNFERERIG